MAPKPFRFKEPHNHVFYTANTINYYLRNSTSVLKNISTQKTNTIVTVLSTTKNVLTRKEKKPIATKHTKDVNTPPCHKDAFLKAYELQNFLCWNQMDYPM